MWSSAEFEPLAKNTESRDFMIAFVVSREVSESVVIRRPVFLNVTRGINLLSFLFNPSDNIGRSVYEVHHSRFSIT